MGSSQAKPSDAESLRTAAVPAPLSFITDVDKEQQQAQKIMAAKETRYANLRSRYVPKPEHAKINLIEAINNEDYESANYLNALKMPMQVQKELENMIETESYRHCFAVEKVMAFCLQDKMWTAWKCQKERDAYFNCREDRKANKILLNDLRWKYTMGVFHGETLARGNIMKSLWKDYFPSRELPHQWVAES
jgi:hypothetical protein